MMGVRLGVVYLIVPRHHLIIYRERKYEGVVSVISLE